MKDFLVTLGKGILTVILVIIGLIALLSTACAGLFAMGGTDRAAGQVFVGSLVVLMLCWGGLRAIRASGKKNEAPPMRAPNQPVSSRPEPDAPVSKPTQNEESP